jgi:hypothetical protein
MTPFTLQRVRHGMNHSLLAISDPTRAFSPLQHNQNWSELPKWLPVPQFFNI